MWRDHFYVHSTEKTTISPPPFKGAGAKEAMTYFLPAVHASFFTPFRFGLPFHHFTDSLFSKEIVLTLQALRCIPLINRHKPRHSRQAFRLHFIPPQPLPFKIGIASFSPATCLPRISFKSPPPFSGAGHNIFYWPFACGPCSFLRFITFQGFVPFVPLCTTTLTLHFTAKVP